MSTQDEPAAAPLPSPQREAQDILDCDLGKGSFMFLLNMEIFGNANHDRNKHVDQLLRDFKPKATELFRVLVRIVEGQVLDDDKKFIRENALTVIDQFATLKAFGASSDFKWSQSSVANTSTRRLQGAGEEQWMQSRELPALLKNNLPPLFEKLARALKIDQELVRSSAHL